MDLNNYDTGMIFDNAEPAATSPFNNDLSFSPPAFSSGNTSNSSALDEEIPLQTLKIL